MAKGLDRRTPTRHVERGKRHAGSRRTQCSSGVTVARSPALASGCHTWHAEATRRTEEGQREGEVARAQLRPARPCFEAGSCQRGALFFLRKSFAVYFFDPGAVRRRVWQGVVVARSLLRQRGWARVRLGDAQTRAMPMAWSGPSAEWACSVRTQRNAGKAWNARGDRKPLKVFEPRTMIKEEFQEMRHLETCGVDLSGCSKGVHHSIWDGASHRVEGLCTCPHEPSSGVTQIGTCYQVVRTLCGRNGRGQVMGLL